MTSFSQRYGHTLSRLPELFELAERADVCVRLDYWPGVGDPWEVSVDSAAPSERWTSRDYSNPDLAIEAGIKHLSPQGGQPLHVLTPAGKRFHERRVVGTDGTIMREKPEEVRKRLGLPGTLESR